MSALQLGDGLSPTSTLGPLMSAAQQQRVASLVSAAVSRGARVLCGGNATTIPAFGYEATVLVDVAHDDALLREEIFGPVAPIVRFGDRDDIVAMANNVDHGLVSYVFSANVARAMATAERLVGMNRGIVSDPAAPFGGMKASGIGREGAHEGLLAFLETKYVAGNWA